MYWSIDKVLAVAAHLSLALGSVVPVNHKILKTTTTKHGKVIDWVVRESQGNVASPPPSPASKGGLTLASDLLDHELGPEGTVPIARSSGNEVRTKQPPKAKQNDKRSKHKSQKGYAGKHWYASSSQDVEYYSTSAIFSLFNPYLEYTTDFSLIQVAVSRTNVPGVGGTGDQTVEAGWANSPIHGARSELFAFYTTDGYQSIGNYISGWNREVAGWVQYDSTIYPGIALNTISVDGGAQHDIKITYTLYKGNWWLLVADTWVGYYPGTLFATSKATSDQTLQSKATELNYYGEVHNSGSALTTTDMGSGEFASAGDGKSAYIRNMTYQDKDGKTQGYTGAADVDDATLYSMQTNYGGSSSWGNYMYLGGPGGGGVIGA